MTVIGLSSGLVVPQVNTTIANTWSYTQMNVVTFNHVWTIINFSFLLQEPGEKLISPTFSDGINDEYKWNLQVYPKGDGESDKGDVSLFVFGPSLNDTKIKAKVNLFILNDKNEKTNAHRFETTFESSGNGTGYRSFIKRDFLLKESNGLLPNDKLTILCEINAINNIVNISWSSNTIRLKESERKLSDDLELLYESQKLSDITLTTRGREFQAHKTILAARSPVFSAMFENETDVQKVNRLEITDVDHEVIREMLRFIYTDKVKSLQGNAEDLLVVADKYELDKLKITCEKALWTNLTVENAADTLILADTHKAHWLKMKVKNYIVIHANDVMTTTGFILMTNTHPLLAAEAIHEFLIFFEIEQNTSKLNL